jgi:hypothetical protein
MPTVNSSLNRLRERDRKTSGLSDLQKHVSVGSRKPMVEQEMDSRRAGLKTARPRPPEAPINPGSDGWYNAD